MNYLLHLWSTDFGMLEAKLRSILSFGAFLVTGFSAIANVIPKYERIANSRLKSALARVHKIVNVLALNWRVSKPEQPQ
jgi:hypothetical protein